LEKKKIFYRKGYKYQLHADYLIMVPICGFSVASLYIELTPAGLLTIFQGYAWDGASGPTIDTKSSMRATLVHDALDQLLREGHIPLKYQGVIDRLLRDIGNCDGMYKWRTTLWLWAVDTFAACKLDPDNGHPVLSAP